MSSPSRLIPPVLHSAPSLTSLRVYSHTPSVSQTPISGSPPGAIAGESSSSAASTVEPLDSILVTELETEIDIADGESANMIARLNDPASDKEAKQNLRDQLRRTLTHAAEASDATVRPIRGKGKSIEVDELHAADLHILVNTIHSPSIMNSSASASWLPICLPKFNPAAFVNAYVMFLRRSDSTPPGPSQDNLAGEQIIGNSVASSVSSVPGGGQGQNEQGVALKPVSSAPPVEIGLVCVCGLADFEAVRGWCSTVSEKLERDGLMKGIVDAISNGRTEYTVGDLSIPGLRHFLYKSRSQVQVTMPTFEDPYENLKEKQRLITLYQTLHDAIHAKSGQESTLKLQYIRTERESVMGWITQPFELYLAMSPLLPKSAIINAANSISRWVQKEEKRLFLRDAPVF
ncbi:hypothetical protein PHLCEN_2v5580 [Hermanssonia centrifuga]|uniref:Vacuolar fusion protein MON1 n=1 Tax=Hermanssonia centrifuga TaxID=98765 RepID=A0A2R6P1X4_9APHY|nr:hypothetical protein PHLCEN_2v5580 [Hermanssonia centrifuga]